MHGSSSLLARFGAALAVAAAAGISLASLGPESPPSARATPGANLAGTPTVGATPTPLVAPEPTVATAVTPPSEASPAPATPAPPPRLTPAPVPTTAATPAPIVVAETNTGPGSEPNVAMSPFDARLVAVSHQRVAFGGGCNLSGVRISRDGGRTFREVAREPWRGHCPDFHGQVAWGPGPGGGSRLWWTDAMLLGRDRVSVGVTYSDDLGASWAPLYVNRATPPWIGGFPDITVDNLASSPSFGTVYVAYNWLASSNGPGVGVLASRDFGRSWSVAQVPAVGLAGYPFYWRIGYRVRALPDGSAIVSFYESDLRQWSTSRIFDQGSAWNIGRVGFATARLHFAPGGRLVAAPAVWAVTLSKRLNGPWDPEWQTGLDVEASGRVWMAVSDASGGGTIHVGHSDDAGASWTWRTLAVSGRSSYKPSLAAVDGVVFVGWHALDSAGRSAAFFSLSYDDGASFVPPRRLGSASFRLPSIVNRTGLRESAEFEAGRVLWAYGDARGPLSVYVATIKP